MCACVITVTNGRSGSVRRACTNGSSGANPLHVSIKRSDVSPSTSQALAWIIGSTNDSQIRVIPPPASSVVNHVVATSIDPPLTALTALLDSHILEQGSKPTHRGLDAQRLSASVLGQGGSRAGGSEHGG